MTKREICNVCPKRIGTFCSALKRPLHADQWHTDPFKDPRVDCPIGSWGNKCVHLGEVIGTEGCRTCGGLRDVDVHSCALHGRCSKNDLIIGLKLCNTCEDKKT